MHRKIMVAAWIGHIWEVLESNKGEFGQQHESTVGLVRGDLWTFVTCVLRAGDVWGKAPSMQEMMAPGLRSSKSQIGERNEIDLASDVWIMHVQPYLISHIILALFIIFLMFLIISLSFFFFPQSELEHIFFQSASNSLRISG